MALYFVRWFDPSRPRPLIRDFHNKAAAETFRARLPYLSEAPKPYPNKPKDWASVRQADRKRLTAASS